MTSNNNVTLSQLETALKTVKNKLDGKADTKHGDHVLYSTTVTTLTPGEDGTAGSSKEVARANHTHTLPEYPKALKSPQSLTIKQNGGSDVTYDGSTKQEVNITCDSIGAAPLNHLSPTTAYGAASDSVYGHAMASSTMPLVAGEGSVGTETAKFARGDHVHPMQTYVTGNSGTTDKLKKAVTITIGGQSKDFDGTQDLEWTISDVGGAVTNHASSLSTYGLSTAILYGHAKASSTEPKMAGSSDVGSETSSFARGDHVHPAQTTISGNAGTATTLKTSRNITIGNLTKSFNGSQDLEYPLTDIGAIPLDGTSTYSINGSLLFNDSGNVSETFRGIQGKCGTNDYWRFGGSQTGSNAGYAEIATGDESNEPIYVRQYSGSFATLTRTATLLDASGNTEFPGNVTAPNFFGNASTADKLKSGKTLTIGNSGKTFDGSTAVSWSLADIGAVAKSGDTMTGNLAIDKTGARYIAKDGTNEIWFGINADKNKWGIYDSKAAKYILEATSSAIQLNGNASSANKLSTARTINGTSFDGSSDVIVPIEYYTCSVSSDNTNQYHRIMTTGITTETYTDKSITIYLTQNYRGGRFGIARVTLRTNSTTSVANGEIKWLVRSGFDVDDLQYNIIDTAGEACLDVFYKSNSTYASVTWHVLAEGGRASYASNTFTKYNTSASTPTEAYTVDDMKALRSYTSTCVAATDDGIVGKAVTADKAIKLSSAKAITLSGVVSGTVNFDGSEAASITTSIVNPPKSGDWFSGGLATVGTDGAIEIGRYIDFHNSDTSTRDYDTRIQCESGAGIVLKLPSTAGTLARTADNVASATKLETARTINGTNFDGTENITTANWGTARDIKIADSTSSHTSSAVSVNGSAPVTLKLPATIKATLDGNASTATKLAASKTINGTAFDGSENITTTKWGTARTLKIGNKAISVDGSSSTGYTWSLADIGAVAKAGDTMTGTLSINKNNNTAYFDVGTSSVYMYNDKAGKSIDIMNDGTLKFNSNIVLDASNYSNYALPKTGGTLSNKLTISSGGLSVTGGISSANHITLDNAKYIQGKNSSGTVVNLIGMGTDNVVYTGSTSYALRLRSSSDPKVTVDSTNYTLYHEGNHTIKSHGGETSDSSNPLGTVYYKMYGSDSSPKTYIGRVTCSYSSDNDQDYSQVSLYSTASGSTGSINYINIYPDLTYTKYYYKSGSNFIMLKGKKLYIASSAPSDASTGDIWIDND